MASSKTAPISSRQENLIISFRTHSSLYWQELLEANILISIVHFATVLQKVIVNL